jgi:lipopolysaccharide/colanic/teichoic acid biosynthesis glycosyltransferase
MKSIYLVIKRFFDIILSLVALIILSPFLMIIALIIKLTSDGNVLYAHRRIGKGGKIIHVLKFRTMNKDNRPLEEILTKEQLEEYKSYYKVTNDPRVTKFGKFLRKTSIDELPQLINIIKGDMSIVGPRPIIFDELKLYKENKELLLTVRPGLTGYWASHGRSDTTYDERIKMELYYVNNVSFWLDVKIIFLTGLNVILGKGAK